MFTTQNQWAADKLLKDGRVSRNEALNRRITRLAARIKDLRDAGWEIIPVREKGNYTYVLVNRPNTKHGSSKLQ